MGRPVIGIAPDRIGIPGARHERPQPRHGRFTRDGVIVQMPFPFAFGPTSICKAETPDAGQVTWREEIAHAGRTGRAGRGNTGDRPPHFAVAPFWNNLPERARADHGTDMPHSSAAQMNHTKLAAMARFAIAVRRPAV